LRIQNNFTIILLDQIIYYFSLLSICLEISVNADIPKDKIFSSSFNCPISLLSVLGKVFEKIIHTQICLYLNTENIVIDEQFGFKRKHSAVAQLLHVTEHFAFEINKHRNSAMLLLNLKKTFDSIWHNGLLYKLLIRLPIYYLYI